MTPHLPKKMKSGEQKTKYPNTDSKELTTMPFEQNFIVMQGEHALTNRKLRHALPIISITTLLYVWILFKVWLLFVRFHRNTSQLPGDKM